MWKPVPGCDGKYEVSVTGVVRRADCKERLAYDHSDYGFYVELRKPGHRKSWPVAQLVLLAHRGPPENPEHTAMRLDGCRENVHVDNLVWASKKDILAHTKKLKLNAAQLEENQDGPAQNALQPGTTNTSPAWGQSSGRARRPLPRGLPGAEEG